MSGSAGQGVPVETHKTADKTTGHDGRNGGIVDFVIIVYFCNKTTREWP